MFIRSPLPVVKEFVDELNHALAQHQPGTRLSKLQCLWVSCCRTGILMTNTVCWAQCARASLGGYSLAALSWMFRHAKIPWECLRQMSLGVMLRQYAMTHGVLVVDDSDHKRGKVTTRIFKAYQLYDKTSGGYLHGQTMVVWRLVTPRITLPAAFACDMPDAALTAWNKADKQRTQPGVSPQQRPPQPSKHPAYPTKPEMALALLEAFRRAHPSMELTLVLADALYATAPFMDQASRLFGGKQVISPLRPNQHVRFRGKLSSIEQYLTRSPGVPQTLKIRGDEEVRAIISRARLSVDAHHTKRLVMALNYEHESEYRYLVAADLSWRTGDMVQGYTLRWLVEVCLEDWKVYEGWGQLTTQPDEAGSRRSLVLSLRLDHCLLLHPQQLARLENNLPACTVGSLRERTRVDSLLEWSRELSLQDNPQEKLTRLSRAGEEVFQLPPSKTHRHHRDPGRLEPTPLVD